MGLVKRKYDRFPDSILYTSMLTNAERYQVWVKGQSGDYFDTIEEATIRFDALVKGCLLGTQIRISIGTQIIRSGEGELRYS